MSQNVVSEDQPENTPKMRRQHRLKEIEQNILYLTQEELAQKCGVDRRTIQRDIEIWRINGGFQRFLIKEFFELYGQERLKKPSLALDRIMTLLLREEQKSHRTQTTVPIKKQVEQIIKISRTNLNNQ